MRIIGKYDFSIIFQNMFISSKAKYHNHNLITINGLNFFSRCMVNNEENINRLAVGTGTISASVNDIQLGNQTNTFNCDNSIQGGVITLSTTVQGNVINGTTEIGVLTNQNILVSHDVHEEVVVPDSATVTIDYKYSFNAGAFKNEWETTSDENVFKINESEEISSVIETDTYSGYIRKYSFNDVVDNVGSYYHDTTNHILYIHTTTNQLPTSYRILINYKYREV